MIRDVLHDDRRQGGSVKRLRYRARRTGAGTDEMYREEVGKRKVDKAIDAEVMRVSQAMRKYGSAARGAAWMGQGMGAEAGQRPQESVQGIHGCHKERGRRYQASQVVQDHQTAPTQNTILEHLVKINQPVCSDV